MEPGPIVDALLAHRVEFVLVGSAARLLLGDAVEPADVDVVVAGSSTNRAAVVSALIELDASVVENDRLHRLTQATVLPWEWSWKVVTAYGPVDMIVRFIDGSGFDEHDAFATDVWVDGGRSLRCHGTRHLQ